MSSWTPTVCEERERERESSVYSIAIHNTTTTTAVDDLLYTTIDEDDEYVRRRYVIYMQSISMQNIFIYTS